MDNEIKTASFAFLNGLDDLLNSGRKDESIQCSFKGRQSVKHLIEALHIPHTEIGQIYVDGKAVDLNYLVQDGDQIKVLPASDVPEHSALRFIVDNHLGKLATYLRILGFDTLYRNDYQDSELARIASREKRILLTRDRGLLMLREIESGYCIRAREPKKQLVEVIKRYNLLDNVRPFRRCLRCNNLLEPISKKSILHRLKPLTKRYYNEFRICNSCDQVYWKGSHFEHMEAFLEEIRKTMR